MGSRLQGKVAIVTGASRGLGEFTAVAYGREGATVAVAARTEQVANERLPGTIYSTAEAVTAAGGEGFPVVCNVADEASVNAMVQAVIERYGRVDILVNNAAVLPPGGMTTIRPRHWELAVKVNVHGPFHAIRAVLPTMTAQGSGSIINVSSVTANEVHGPYGATKHSLEGLTVAFARELAGSGVTVNCLKPAGGIDTPGLRFAELEDSVYQNLPPADRYVEAAILLALLTPDQGTGLVCHDTEVIERWASEPLRSQLAALPRG